MLHANERQGVVDKSLAILHEPAESAPVLPRPVQSAIAARSTVRRFRYESVSTEIIQRLLVAGVQAPNHRRTRPWRFFVVGGPGSVRRELEELARVAALARVPNV